MFQDIVDSAQELLSELMAIPDNYKILFLQGGATTQFSMVPLNLFSKYKKADYAITGSFAKKLHKRLNALELLMWLPLLLTKTSAIFRM